MARTGRKPVTGETRSKDTACFRLSETEARALDGARGTVTRSDFLRQAMHDAIERQAK
jgi:hypothetical protein